MYAVLQISDFPLQAALRFSSPELHNLPLAAIRTATKQGEILAANVLARNQGVTRGMPSAQGLARCPDLRFIPACPRAEANTQALLLQTAGTLSPSIESTAPGVCTVDLRGIRGGPRSEVERALKALLSAQLVARAGIAPLPDLARLAAAKANPLLLVDSSQEFLKQLPLPELSQDRRLLKTLQDWGIHTVRDLLALPRQEALERLGPEGMSLWTTARGGKARPLLLESFPENYEESLDFDSGIEAMEPLLFVLKRFLDSLSMRLESTGRAASTLSLTLRMESGPPHVLRLRIPSPTADPEVLQRILFSHIESLRLPHRATGAHLCVAPILQRPRQFELFHTPLRDPNRFGETVARLRAITGTGSLGVPSAADTHLPGSFTLKDPETAFTTETSSPGKANLTPPGLPLRRMRPSQNITVKLNGGEPRFVSGARFSGPVRECRGPYRISGHWWAQDSWSLEEWDIEVDCTAANFPGRAERLLARIGRNSSGAWHLEGVYNA
jgi:protein ImuB